jgi:hypothetical protein
MARALIAGVLKQVLRIPSRGRDWSGRSRDWKTN